jgi:hypothetical protein
MIRGIKGEAEGILLWRWEWLEIPRCLRRGASIIKPMD